MALTLVGGGRRSGKSRYAAALASARGSRLCFIATLVPSDEETTAIAARARSERGTAFQTVEEPRELVRAVEERLTAFDAIIVDDLTVWVSNLFMAGRRDDEIEQLADELIRLAGEGPAEVIVVTSDVDFGFPPDLGESRRFRRLAGLINRRIAESAPRIFWMVFGIPNKVRQG